MLIDKITLKDFRIYRGINQLSFHHHSEKNVTVISGNNGFGKTTFLTSLVWCLYGKLMVDVDDRFKREIYESGGYKRFCQKTINRASWLNPEKKFLKEKLQHARGRDLDLIQKEIDSLNSFSVSIVLSDLFIPSVPCNKVEIIRSFNVDRDEEQLDILIDGRANELTKEVGPEIFVHDFIMPKEIAKFFFFDAEKIVSLAEIKSVDEKRDLSRAYTEVLGIKKYEDLKHNLENIRMRLRSSQASGADRTQLEKLNREICDNEKLQVHYKDTLEIKYEELARKREEAGRLQEKLIREGSTISSEEFNDLKLLKASTAEEFKKANLKFKDFVELAPFAIASKKLSQINQHLFDEEENQTANHSSEYLKRKISSFKKELDLNNDELKLSEEAKNKLVELLSKELIVSSNKSFKPLMDFSQEQINKFRALYGNITNSYSERFKALVQEVRVKQSALAIIVNKLSNAETKESDLVIKEIRSVKSKLEAEIETVEDEIIELKVKIETRRNEYKNLQKRQSELSKKVEVAITDQKKDEVSDRLIKELNVFLKRLKEKKKESLEQKILVALKGLMHKKHFIDRVEVVLEEDMLDIEFYDAKGNVINKDGLSKGEQQLYATALLKALVEESNIKFPIFIDSPLQKFDQQHADNIIKDFYPSISEQVILLPLLEKELTQQEYNKLLPKVSKAFLIKNIDKDQSIFKECKTNELFTTMNQEVYV